jgi:hypothetical protein
VVTADFLIPMEVGFVLALLTVVVTVALIVVLLVWVARRKATRG